MGCVYLTESLTERIAVIPWLLCHWYVWVPALTIGTAAGALFGYRVVAATGVILLGAIMAAILGSN